MNRIRPAAWLMAAVALFLLAVAGYALLVHASPQYYWTLVGVINGWQPEQAPADVIDTWEWYGRALRAHA